MANRAMTIAAAAVAALLLSGPFDSADAYKGGWSGGHHHHIGGSYRSFQPGRFYSGRVYNSYKFAGVHHHHRFHGRRYYFVGAPVYGAYYGYGYGYGGCYWLRERAIYTGSRYWWNRYYDCLNDYD